MANVIGNGSISQIADVDGDPITTSNRFPVETEQDDAFSTFVSYPTFTAHTTVEALNGSNHLNITNVADAKEILIQTDDANTSYIMVGSSAGTTVANATVANRKGIKLNGGETLILALSTFANIFIDASTSSQFVNVAYFK